MKLLHAMTVVLALGSVSILTPAVAGDNLLLAEATSTEATGQGTVNKVDPSSKTVNLDHDEIKALGWPPMTMDLKVQDASILDSVKPGMKVTFNIKKMGKDFVITSMQPADSSASVSQ